MIGRERGEHMPELSRDELLARISSEYYLDNRSKVEIGASYGVSRFQVARLLTEAREKGIVEIKVHFPSRVSGADIRRIESSLGIGEVVVTDTSGDAAQDRGVLARAAAAELSRQAPVDGTLGISWSRTLDMASRLVRELPRCDVVQLAGALPTDGDSNPLELIQRLGHLSGGLTWPLWAPLVVEDTTTAAGLRRQPEIAGALARADSLDLAVVAIGAWKPGTSTVWDRADADVRQAAVEAGTQRRLHKTSRSPAAAASMMAPYPDHAPLPVISPTADGTTPRMTPGAATVAAYTRALSGTRG